MLRIFVFLAALAGLGFACGLSPMEVPVVEPLARPVSFLEDVKPVLDRRCVVCHSCYNAACQLKLSSFEGADRGGSKAAVYSSSRLTPQQPTRLFTDAQSTDGWRQLDFHSVLESSVPSPQNDSLMYMMLAAKQLDPKPRGSYHAEASDLTCAANSREMGRFLARNPEKGMPFGFPALGPGEHAVLSTWLARGAPGPTPDEQAALIDPPPDDAAQIERWESFLNRSDAKHRMTGRYLYEHFFLAHLRFSKTPEGPFYELVRSSTPPGEPISVIATVRPYDDPGVDRAYYRLRKIHSTIVRKTHMVVVWSDERLARYRELFIEPEWLAEPRVIPHAEVVDANPFVVYAQIPPRSRYQFLLDHSDYIIRSFMQGPVCKGQIALDVVRDHFWVFFMDPDADQAVLHPEFLAEQAGNLRLPNEKGSNQRLLKAFSDNYRERYAAFYKAKMALYREHAPDGEGIDAIWRGERPEDHPLLTVYRHFDSASLHLGPLGDLPKTLWVIDYAQFERIYYALVAGFDVFGNLSHQVNVRRYMDYLRVEGELNFVQFLPPETRYPIFEHWYEGSGALEDTNAAEILTSRPTQVVYQTDDPKRELVERLVDDHLLDSLGIAFDDVNYRQDGQVVPMPTRFESTEDLLNGFRALTAPGTGFIRHVTTSEANVLWLRVRQQDRPDAMVSIVINRWHDNVSTLFREAATLDPTKDEIDFHRGPIGEYPNYFLDVAREELPDFFDLLAHFDGSPAYIAKFERYGVNRADERFWELYDWFQAAADEADPVNAGLYDLNRYASKAVE